MYSYALNNPLAFVDPTGLDSCPQAAVALGNMGDDSSDDGGCDPPQELPNIDPCEGQGSSCEQKDAAKNIAESADALSMVDWMLQGCRAALQVTNKDQAGLLVHSVVGLPFSRPALPMVLPQAFLQRSGSVNQTSREVMKKTALALE